MRTERIHSVADARRLAKRTLPKVAFDYVDGAADDEVTMRKNEAAFDDVDLVPHMATGITDPDLSTTVLGAELSLPILLAPAGLIRVIHPGGGVAAARGAAARGTLSVLSTVAATSLEEVAATGAPFWFQLYAPDRAESEERVERARRAGADALVVTVDTPVLGNRERDVHNGVSPPLRVTPSSAVHLGPQVLTRPLWVWRMVRDGIRPASAARAPQPADQPLPPGGQAATTSIVATAATVTRLASPLSWADIGWLRSVWERPLVVKGILSAEDGRRAVDAGADAVIVSNHGGRQLDGALPTLRALPEVVAAVGDRCQVLFDSGIRRGSHVAKALALGARAVLIGRAYLYGLAFGGEAGVVRVLDVLRAELARTLSLMGCPSVAELGPQWLSADPSGLNRPGAPPTR